VKTLLTRAFFGAIFVAIVVGSILLGFEYFAGVVMIITGITSIELYHIFKKMGYAPNLTLNLLVALLSIAAAVVYIQGIVPSASVLLIPLGVAFFGFGIELFNSHHRSLENVALNVFSWFYVVIPFILLLFLSQSYQVVDMSYERIYHSEIILSILILMWSFDSFAYLTGVSIGKHKMAEKISPKKSWEGFFGGLIATIVISYFIAQYWGDGNVVRWIVIAIITAVFGTFGDFFESKIKRQAGIKDSGNIMPGHGGLLDRFDALLIVVPIIFVYIQFIEPLL
jgi:phosphatidate cytidylyltransferase